MPAHQKFTFDNPSNVYIGMNESGGMTVLIDSPTTGDRVELDIHLKELFILDDQDPKDTNELASLAGDNGPADRTDPPGDVADPRPSPAGEVQYRSDATPATHQRHPDLRTF